MKHFILFFIAVIFFVPTFARAGIVITEIMYDPSGADSTGGKNKEWVEIYNSGVDSVSITSAWRFVENNSKHTVEAVTIPSGGYAVIVDDKDTFMSLYPSFSGTLIDSSFSLSNSGTTISLRDADSIDTDSVTYSSSQGASGDGKSLQRGANGWGVGNPTPGLVNVIDDNVPSVDSNQDQASTTTATTTNTTTNNGSQNQTITKITNWYSHSSQSEATFGGDVVEFVVTGGRDRLGFVGNPLVFEAKVKQPQNLNLGNVTFDWSMGDGTVLGGSFIKHTYQFAGEYNVVLNATYRAERAVARLKVKIVEPNISITEANNNFIEISNKGDFEANIGMWTIDNNREKFIIPNDTIIPKNTSIKIPTVVTKLSDFNDGLALLNPSANIVASQKTGGMVAGDFEMMILDAPPRDVLEKRLREAMLFYGNKKIVKSETVSLGVPTIVNKPVIFSQIKPTSTPSTTVIFTVPKTKEASFFKRIFGR